jgi:hypothetical protein
VAPAENLAFQRQAALLVVGEAQPSGTVRGAEDTVLLEEVVDDCLRLPVDPAGDKKEEEGERGRQRDHGRSVTGEPLRFKGHRPRTSWMSAYLAVFTHPFFGVSNDHGIVELNNLPAGTFQVQA